MTNTKPVTIHLTEQYQADIPQNYIKFQKEISNPEQYSTLHLWALYPSFEGYSQSNADIFKLERQLTSKVVNFNFYYNAPYFNDDQLKAYFGQKGVKALLDTHKDLQLKLADQQPYGNQIKHYHIKNSMDKAYIYDSGDQAVFIRCSQSLFNEPLSLRCSAYKLWGNTRIRVEIKFNIHLLRNFNRIEAEVDKLIHTFNLREI